MKIIIDIPFLLITLHFILGFVSAVCYFYLYHGQLTLGKLVKSIFISASGFIFFGFTIWYITKNYKWKGWNKKLF